MDMQVSSRLLPSIQEGTPPSGFERVRNAEARLPYSSAIVTTFSNVSSAEAADINISLPSTLEITGETSWSSLCLHKITTPHIIVASEAVISFNVGWCIGSYTNYGIGLSFAILCGAFFIKLHTVQLEDEETVSPST